MAASSTKWRNLFPCVWSSSEESPEGAFLLGFYAILFLGAMDEREDGEGDGEGFLKEGGES